MYTLVIYFLWTNENIACIIIQFSGLIFEITFRFCSPSKYLNLRCTFNNLVIASDINPLMCFSQLLELSLFRHFYEMNGTYKPCSCEPTVSHCFTHDSLGP